MLKSWRRPGTGNVLIGFIFPGDISLHNFFSLQYVLIPIINVLSGLQGVTSVLSAPSSEYTSSTHEPCSLKMDIDLLFHAKVNILMACSKLFILKQSLYV